MYLNRAVLRMWMCGEGRNECEVEGSVPDRVGGYCCLTFIILIFNIFFSSFSFSKIVVSFFAADLPDSYIGCTF